MPDYKVIYKVIVTVTEDTQGRKLNVDVDPSFIFMEDALSTLERAAEHLRGILVANAVARVLLTAREAAVQAPRVTIPSA